MFSKGFPSLTPISYNNTIAVLSRHNAISQQLHSGAIQLTSAALLRFILLLDQNQAQYFETVDKCQLYQARGTQTTVILERSNNRCIDSPHIKQKCQCPTFVLYVITGGERNSKGWMQYSVYCSLPLDLGS